MLKLSSAVSCGSSNCVIVASVAMTSVKLMT